MTKEEKALRVRRVYLEMQLATTQERADARFRDLVRLVGGTPGDPDE